MNENISQEQPIVKSETTNPKSEIKTSEIQKMEVHHHPDLHHRKKHWKEYFLEFLMIFLAVTLGFFAESYRENLSDRAKEREYMQSLIQDLKEDTAMINASNAINGSVLIPGLDTLENLLFNFKNNDSAISRCYSFFGYVGGTPVLNFNERTVSQLLSSGNMRLIKNQNVADSVIQYYNAIKNTDGEKEMITTNQMRTLDAARSIFNFYYNKFKFNKDSTGLEYVIKNFNEANKMLTTDTTKIKEYAGLVNMQKTFCMVYLFIMKDLKKQAVRLLLFLQKEYHLQ